MIIISLMSCATTGSKSADKPGVVVTNVKTVTAKVEVIDYQTRLVTIRGQEGNLVVLHADESIRNFDQVRVGDKVKAEVLESVALYVQKHDGTKPSIREGAAVAVARKGDKPGIAAADTVVITATVEAVDYDTRMLTLKVPGGASKVLKVDEQARDMEKVKVGDQVVVRYTVAVAITVNKPEK